MAAKIRDVWKSFSSQATSRGQKSQLVDIFVSLNCLLPYVGCDGRVAWIGLEAELEFGIWSVEKGFPPLGQVAQIETRPGVAVATACVQAHGRSDRGGAAIRVETVNGEREREKKNAIIFGFWRWLRPYRLGRTRMWGRTANIWVIKDFWSLIDIKKNI